MSELFPTVGESKSVVRSLSHRIGRHSPELILQLQEYLQRHDEDIDFRQSFDGSDASSKLSFALLEALLAYEQLRMELSSQVSRKTPGRIMQAMSVGMKVEPALIWLAKKAFELHLMIWNADSLRRRPRVELESERMTVDNSEVSDGGSQDSA